MWTDPIVGETRKLREAYFAEFDYNLDTLVQQLQEQERKSGRELASLPPRKPERSVSSAA